MINSENCVVFCFNYNKWMDLMAKQLWQILIPWCPLACSGHLDQPGTFAKQGTMGWHRPVVRSLLKE